MISPRLKADSRTTRSDGSAGARAFTLLEVMLAIVIFSIVLTAAHVVFASALRLRSRTVDALESALPIEQALAIFRTDLQSLVAPTGVMSGPLQSLPTNRVLLGQMGPYFYTSGGHVTDFIPWADRQCVAYRLLSPSNNTEGLDLVRSVARNLLPVLEEKEFEDHFVMSGVEQLQFQYYDGSQWRSDWDSTTETLVLPLAIRVQLLLSRSRTNQLYREPIELVVPLEIRPPENTNATSSTTSSTGAGSGTGGGA